MPEGPDRLPPIPASELTEAQREAVDAVVAGPRGELASNWVPWLRSPGLMARVQELGAWLRFEKSLDEPVLELAILCVARHWDNDFEWWFHHPLALAAGVPSEVVEAVGLGQRPATDPDLATVHDLVVGLLRDGSVSDEVYAAAVALLGDTGVVEVTGVVGYYTTLALAMNLARTPAPPGPRLP